MCNTLLKSYRLQIYSVFYWNDFDAEYMILEYTIAIIKNDEYVSLTVHAHDIFFDICEYLSICRSNDYFSKILCQTDLKYLMIYKHDTEHFEHTKKFQTNFYKVLGRILWKRSDAYLIAQRVYLCVNVRNMQTRLIGSFGMAS